MIRTLTRGAGIGLAMIGIFSCSEHSVTGSDNLNTEDLAADAARIATVGVSFASSSIAVGDTTRATATLRDYQGRLLLSRYITWTSSDSTVATVSPTGLVTGVSEGTALITASRSGKTGSGTITVTAGIGGTSTPPPPSTNPGTVTDLKVMSADSTGVTLSFTQVNDGTGQPAKYDIRYAASPIAWGSATSATSGSCAVPVAGTAIGTSLVCKVIGLQPSTKYDFQLVAFRGTLNFDAVFGALSIVATATTTASAPPPTAAVASVTVSPATATVQVGSTVQLSATDRDVNGNVLTGRVVTWSTANAAIAAVNSSTGLVTALVAGTTQITATSEGKSGSATVTVTALPPPPPPGSSNEPAGMTKITDRPFNTTGEGWSDWWPSGLITFVSDPTAPHSPTGILRATYPAGFSAGTGPGAWDAPMLGNKKTAYVAIWLRHSANWYGQDAGVNKVFYMHTSTNDAPVFYFSATGVGSGDLIPQIRLQATVSPPESNLSPNLVSAKMVRGQWNLIEVVAVGNSAGNRDGSVDWYLNGVHIGSYTGIEWEAGGTTWQRFSIAPVWGGIGGTVPATQWLDFDHAYLSVK